MEAAAPPPHFMNSFAASVKRRPASSAEHTCRQDFLVVRTPIEVLLSLLFALRCEAEASAHLGGAIEWRR
jgi:hypothetical protein